MSLKRNVALSLVAGGLAAGGYAAAQGLAQATQAPVVVSRFLLGYYDGQGRFVPTAGRGATNVDPRTRIQKPGAWSESSRFDPEARSMMLALDCRRVSASTVARNRSDPKLPEPYGASSASNVGSSMSDRVWRNCGPIFI